MKFSALQISTIAALILVFIIHQYGFKKGSPTCNNYVINTYLYLALSVTLLGIAIQTIKWSPFESNSVMPTFVSIIILFGLIIYISAFQNINQKTTTEVILSHTSWVAFIATMSLFISIYFNDPILKQNTSKAMMMAALIFMISSSVVYFRPQFFEDTYGVAMATLLIALITIIIVEVVSILSQDIQTTNHIFHYTSYVVILLFSAFTAYDTSKMFQRAEKCTDMPNYPKASVGFFLDLINLFIRNGGRSPP